MTKATDEMLRARLDEARVGGDRATEADVLVRWAACEVDAGRFDTARGLFDRAVEIERELGRSENASRGLHMGATVARLAGDAEGAEERAEAALELAPDPSPPRVAALAELGEQAAAAGRFAVAAERFAEALEAGEVAGLHAHGRAALLSRIAGVLTAAGRAEDGALAAFQAGRIAEEAGFPSLRLQTLVDEATAWATAGKDEEAADARDRGIALATELDDQPARARLQLLAAASAFEVGDLTGALAAAEQARAAALACRSPQSYVGAVVAAARVHEHRGDRTAAYGALATGWVTLGELMGPAVARSTFEPLLSAAAERWGRAPFREAQAQYEAQAPDRDRPGKTSSDGTKVNPSPRS